MESLKGFFFMTCRQVWDWTLSCFPAWILGNVLLWPSLILTKNVLKHRNPMLFSFCSFNLFIPPFFPFSLFTLSFLLLLQGFQWSHCQLEEVTGGKACPCFISDALPWINRSDHLAYLKAPASEWKEHFHTDSCFCVDRDLTTSPHGERLFLREDIKST